MLRFTATEMHWNVGVTTESKLLASTPAYRSASCLTRYSFSDVALRLLARGLASAGGRQAYCSLSLPRRASTQNTSSQGVSSADRHFPNHGMPPPYRSRKAGKLWPAIGEHPDRDLRCEALPAENWLKLSVMRSRWCYSRTDACGKSAADRCLLHWV
jgi:hypothetical protein